MTFRFMGEQEDPELNTIEARGNVRIYDGTRPAVVVHGLPIQHDHTQRTYPCGLVEYREQYDSGRHVHVSTRPGDAITCPGCLEAVKP